MIIITIKFAGKSGKTYDYLMKNPESLKYDKTRPIYFAAEGAKSGHTPAQIQIIGYRRVATLPSHVTAKLTIGSENWAFSSPIAKTDLAAEGTTKTVTPELANAMKTLYRDQFSHNPGTRSLTKEEIAKEYARRETTRRISSEIALRLVALMQPPKTEAEMLKMSQLLADIRGGKK